MLILTTSPRNSRAHGSVANPIFDRGALRLVVLFLGDDHKQPRLSQKVSKLARLVNKLWGLPASFFVAPAHRLTSQEGEEHWATEIFKGINSNPVSVTSIKWINTEAQKTAEYRATGRPRNSRDVHSVANSISSFELHGV